MKHYFRFRGHNSFKFPSYVHIKHKFKCSHNIQNQSYNLKTYSHLSNTEEDIDLISFRKTNTTKLSCSLDGNGIDFENGKLDVAFPKHVFL